MIKILSPGWMKFISWFVGRADRPFAAWNAFGLPIMVVREEKYLHDEEMEKHEAIHSMHLAALLFLLGWVIYLYFLVTRGYSNHPFEKAAYAGEHIDNYINWRYAYDWVNYVGKLTFADYFTLSAITLSFVAYVLNSIYL